MLSKHPKSLNAVSSQEQQQNVSDARCQGGHLLWNCCLIDCSYYFLATLHFTGWQCCCACAYLGHMSDSWHCQCTVDLNKTRIWICYITINKICLNWHWCWSCKRDEDEDIPSCYPWGKSCWYLHRLQWHSFLVFFLSLFYCMNEAAGVQPCKLHPGTKFRPWLLRLKHRLGYWVSKKIIARHVNFFILKYLLDNFWQNVNKKIFFKNAYKMIIK